MNRQVLNNFFNTYIGEICPLLNPLDTEHINAYLKFRSEVEVAEVSKIFEDKTDDMVEFSFTLIPDEITKFKFKIIEEFFFHLFTSSVSVLDDLSGKQFIIDLYYKKITEYSFPAIQVKIYFIGDFVDLSFVSFINYSLTEANHIIRTDPGFWKRKKLSQLPIILSNRNTDPFDFFPYSNFFMISKFSFNHLVNLNLINFYVPKIYTIKNFLEDKLPIFNDIRILKNEAHPDLDYDEFNKGDYEGGYEEGSDDLPF